MSYSSTPASWATGESMAVSAVILSAKTAVSFPDMGKI
jgi:hypothetical protein